MSTTLDVGCASAHHSPVDRCAEAHPASISPGQGHVELTLVNGRTVATRLAATSPLKLLNPRTNQDECAWIFTSNYGGGLLGGDALHLNVDAGPETRSLLSTQASTKIFRSNGPTTSQRLNASIEENALLVCWPDPIVCFADAKYAQRQRFELRDQSSSLIMIDWFTSGRRARGERWAFDRYQSHTDIFVENSCIFRDNILLDPRDGAIDTPIRIGHVDCLATVVIVGAPLHKKVEHLLTTIAQQPMPGGPLLFSASPIRGGLVLRVAGRDTEQVGRWIREQLGFVAEFVGHDPLARKW